jgi:hypothetical protein
MPLIKKRTTLTANGEAYPLQGDQYEILTFDAFVEFAVLGDTAAEVNATIHSGTDLLMGGSLVDILAVAEPILYPHHYSLSDWAEAQDRLSVYLLELAAATPVVRTQCKITPG